MSDADEVLAWLAERKTPLASKQDMIHAGLNVFGFDLAMESFHRRDSPIPDVFAYAHENGVLVFINQKTPAVEDQWTAMEASAAGQSTRCRPVVCPNCGPQAAGRCEKCDQFLEPAVPDSLILEAWDALASDPHREEAHSVLARLMELLDPPEGRQLLAGRIRTI